MIDYFYRRTWPNGLVLYGTFQMLMSILSNILNIFQFPSTVVTHYDATVLTFRGKNLSDKCTKIAYTFVEPNVQKGF